MKKQICTILLIFTGIVATYGQDFSLSAGVGGLLGGFFTRYTLSADGIDVNDNNIKIDANQDMNQLNYGCLAFFDATYGVFSVYYQRGTNNYTETFEIHGSGREMPAGTGDGWDSNIGFSFLGKYPFSLNERLTVFPMLGMDYQISIRQQRTEPDGWVYDRDDGFRDRDKDGNAYKVTDWNSAWVNLGGGVDFMITDKIFLRAELLYSFRLMTSYERKNLALMKDISGDPSPKLGGLTSGPSIRIGAGYRFFTR